LKQTEGFRADAGEQILSLLRQGLKTLRLHYTLPSNITADRKDSNDTQTSASCFRCMYSTEIPSLTFCITF